MPDMISPSNIVEANFIPKGNGPGNGTNFEGAKVRRVFVLDREKKPLMPCHPARAKELLDKGKAAVFRRYPFTIILKEREGGVVQSLAFKVDPGSKVTGIALVADFERGKEVVWASEIEHRGQVIRDSLSSRRALRRGRRNRRCRYRAPRFLNRTRRAGWLPPSLESRIANSGTWLGRVRRVSPVSSVSVELVKFDTQLMENPEISGVEYQQGELQGYEVREYLLEKWGRACAYCGAKDVPLQVEHVVPRSRGGSNRISNLTLSCGPCNKAKGAMTAEEFGHPEIQARAKEPLKDAAAVNSTRWALFGRLKNTGLPVECGTGGKTKYNRMRLGLPKVHWIDAACVGRSGESVKTPKGMAPLHIKAVGHGRRQRCLSDKFGFPRAHSKRAKIFQGWRTGDMAKTKDGVFGRIAIRHRLSFRMGKRDIHPKNLVRIHRTDGYDYLEKEAAHSPAA